MSSRDKTNTYRRSGSCFVASISAAFVEAAPAAAPSGRRFASASASVANRLLLAAPLLRGRFFIFPPFFAAQQVPFSSAGFPSLPVEPRGFAAVRQMNPAAFRPFKNLSVPAAPHHLTRGPQANILNLLWQADILNFILEETCFFSPVVPAWNHALSSKGGVSAASSIRRRII